MNIFEANRDKPTNPNKIQAWDAAAHSGNRQAGDAVTSIMNLLQRYNGADPENVPASVHEDFKQVAEGAPTEHLASGLNDAFRSDQTPPFETMVASLFGASNGEQKAGILNQLLGAVGPSVRLWDYWADSRSFWERRKLLLRTRQSRFGRKRYRS